MEERFCLPPSLAMPRTAVTCWLRVLVVRECGLAGAAAPSYHPSRPCSNALVVPVQGHCLALTMRLVTFWHDAPGGDAMIAKPLARSALATSAWAEASTGGHHTALVNFHPRRPDRRRTRDPFHTTRPY